MDRKCTRQEAIVRIAQEVFLANGFAGTSMSAIAARLGGSKGTLYNHFGSKAELFKAVIERKCEQFMAALYEAELHGGDLRTALVSAGERIVELALSDESVAIYRIIIAENERFPEIGQSLYRAGPRRGREQMARFLQLAKEKGRFRPDADVEVAADQFFGLCVAEIQQRRLWGAEAAPSNEQIRAYVENGVDTFLRAFGT